MIGIVLKKILPITKPRKK